MSKLRENCAAVKRQQVKGLVELEMIMLGLEDVPFWITGSYRRMKMISNDIDVVIILQDASMLARVCGALLQRFGGLITDACAPRTNIVDGGVAYQFNLIEKERLGAMLLHTTGSWEFNMVLRSAAKRKGWKLNQYGIYEENTIILESGREEDFFSKLNVEYVAPKDRG